MSKTKKMNKLNTIKKTIKTKEANKTKTRTMRSRIKRFFMLKNTTPEPVLQMSRQISDKLNGSYSPTINRNLVSLKSIPREDLMDCNIEKAFQLKEPLKIGIPKTGRCYDYYTSEARRFMLRNLAANKHVNPAKIVPPIQSRSNCWFNAMFVTFFVSDKGRKFFHHLRQLMIEGKQQNGAAIPTKIRDAFALLNFGVDACLTGNEYAYRLDTNSIIQAIYDAIPQYFKMMYPLIVKVNDPGNPILYYIAIINYLKNNAVQMLLISHANSKWKDMVTESVAKMTHLPHIIVLEVYDEYAAEFNKKPVTFMVRDAKYAIDSAVIRDTSQQHFCSMITCEGKEMGYDGASFHRLVPMSWKHIMNRDIDWEFEGTNNIDGSPLKWNFMKCYQLLIYYRVK